MEPSLFVISFIGLLGTVAKFFHSLAAGTAHGVHFDDGRIPGLVMGPMSACCSNFVVWVWTCLCDSAEFDGRTVEMLSSVLSKTPESICADTKGVLNRVQAKLAIVAEGFRLDHALDTNTVQSSMVRSQNRSSTCTCSW